MMKRSRLASAAVFAFLALCLPLSAQKKGADAESALRRTIRKSIEELSEAYAKAHPERTMKKALAVMDFDSPEGASRAKTLSPTLRAYVEEELSRSLVFYIVDRKNLEKIMEEMELSLSGMFDESSAPRLGELKAAQALVLGEASEAGDSIHVSMKLLDVETGVVSAASSFDVNRGDLSAAATELQYRYVAANGIGLTGGAGLFFPYTDAFNRNLSAPFEFGVNYRPDRAWMLSAGIVSRMPSTESDTRFAEGWLQETDYTYAFFQPGGTYASGSSDSINDLEGGGDNGGEAPMVRSNYDFLMMGISGQYTLNIAPWFNIGIQGGPLFHLYEPRMSLVYGSGDLTGLYYRQRYWDADLDAYDYHPAVDTKPIQYVFTSMGFAGARAEIRPEFFITPRLAVALRVGYLWTLPLTVGEVNTSYANWGFRAYQEGVDPATWVPDDEALQTGDELYQGDDAQVHNQVDQRASWLYYGWNPLIRPDGSRWIFDASRFYAMIGFTVYF
jgi:TolB-like protein